MLGLHAISVSYGKVQAVDDLSLSLQKGQIGCLLGPSGCGKTTVLRAIAGFEPITSGELKVRDSAVSSRGHTIAPEKRKIAVVFQDFALFPHLTVSQNIAFGLHDMGKNGVKQRIAEMLLLVELEGSDNKFPHQLSGGQQQRVALARAMAPKPELILMDEPFANLDAELREDLAKQIRQIIKHEGTTALMVTHDQHEAFAISDVIGVMQSGKLHQWGTAYDLYHRPQTRFVADFVGNGVFVSGTVEENRMVNTELGRFILHDRYPYDSGQKVEVLVRPDDILHDDDSSLKAQVIAKTFKGAHILYELILPSENNTQVLCLAPSHHDHNVGESIGIYLDLEHLILFKV